MKNIVPILMLCIGVAVACPALGQKKKAKVLFDEGVAALEQKKYGEALLAFEEAYEISPHWAVLAHIGTCYARLDRPVKAVKNFEKYLADGGNKITPDERKTAENMIAQQKQKLGVLVLSVGKEGVEALVDGETLGKSPFEEILLSPGSHEVAVIFDTRDIVKRDIDLAGGEVFVLRVEQETHVSTVPPPVVVPTPPVEKKIEPVPEKEEAAPVFNPPPAEAEVEGSLVPFGVLLGITIADAIATGISWGFFTYYRGSANNYKSTLDGLRDEPNFSDFTWDDTCSQQSLSLDTEVYFCKIESERRDFMDKSDKWMVAGIAASATLAVTGTLTVLFGVNRHWFGGSGEDSADFSFVPLLGPGENGLMLNVSF